MLLDSLIKIPSFQHCSRSAHLLVGFGTLISFDMFFHFFCINNKMDMLQVVALEYYSPIFLMALVIYMIKWQDRGCVVLMHGDPSINASQVSKGPGS